MEQTGRTTLLTALLAALVAASGCSSNDGNGDDGKDGGTSAGQDSGTGTGADASAPDMGPPRCWRDQDCDSGEVCNVVSGECGPGVTCQDNNDCDQCSALTNANDCGHGFHVVAYCDTARGSVCTRGLANCEPCTTDAECTTLPRQLGFSGQAGKCIDYGNENKFCGRAAQGANCPLGFVDDNGFCKSESCVDGFEFCPAGVPGQNCMGTDQICVSEECPGTGGALCTGNDLPGMLGICINFCDEDADCPETRPICNTNNGLCIAGCQKDSCAGGQVCHADGFCGPPCDSNANCEDRFTTDFYCNLSTQVQPPTYYKNYHDENSCRKKGCERNLDCNLAGIVCDKKQAPYPTCVEGCFEKNDCLSGEVCQNKGSGAKPQSYGECRALGEKTNADDLGLCCDPGCQNRFLQCDINQWCCGEPGSPFESSGACGMLEDPVTMQSRMATPGECFDISPPPFCVQCEGQEGECNSGWTFGFNTNPTINGGQPFQEQEMCFGVADGLNMCTVTCSPLAPDTGCPRGWQCTGFFPPCLQDSDCQDERGSLTCVGADTTVDPPRAGKCLCNTDAECPDNFAQVPETIAHPRCVEQGGQGQKFCVASYFCMPPFLSQNQTTGEYNYPDACLQ